MRIICPHCRNEYDALDNEYGRYVKCAKCGKGFVAGTSSTNSRAMTEMRKTIEHETAESNTSLRAKSTTVKREPISLQLARVWYYLSMFAVTFAIILLFWGGIAREDPIVARFLIGLYSVVMASFIVLAWMIKRHKKTVLWWAWAPIVVVLLLVVLFDLVFSILFIGFLLPAIIVLCNAQSEWWNLNSEITERTKGFVSEEHKTSQRRAAEVTLHEKKEDNASAVIVEGSGSENNNQVVSPKESFKFVITVICTVSFLLFFLIVACVVGADNRKRDVDRYVSSSAVSSYDEPEPVDNSLPAEESIPVNPQVTEYAGTGLGKKLYQAAQKGDAQAQYELGMAYAKGEEVEKDDKEAVKWFFKAAEQGLPEAQFALSARYLKGLGVEQNWDAGERWCRRAAEGGLADAQNMMTALCFIKASGFKKSGDSAAEEKELLESFEWTRKAAAQGHAGAQCNLGIYYYDGTGVCQDKQEAISWYRKSAAQGERRAQYRLGLMYFEGDGVSENRSEAAKWYRKAADQGHLEAQYALGRCYNDGEGVVQNIAEAVKWFRKASENEDTLYSYCEAKPVAQYHLGLCCVTGKGVEKDFAQAAYWFRKSAESGNNAAQYFLAGLYSIGKGVTESKAEAFRWYMKSAEGGYARAQYELGRCYENGDGVEQDKPEAIEWYKKSAEQGNQDSVQALKRLHVESR